MHVLVALQHYHTPDCPTSARPWSLVSAFVEHGHRVTVLTTDAWRRQRVARRFDWVPDGVRLRVVDVPYANEMTTGERLRAYAAYAAAALWKGARQTRPDLVFASSTPLSVGALGAALATRWRCPWIFEVRDLWPDFPAQMGGLDGRPLLRAALYALERFLYRHADHVVTASPDMTTHVRGFTPAHKVSTIAYGTDFDLLAQVGAREHRAVRHRLPSKAKREKIVLYAGAFGRANDLPTLVEAARHFARERAEAPAGGVRFVFAGRGYHRPLLERAARRLPNVSLLDPLPYPEALALFARADLTLVSFLDRPILATNAPSKFFDSLATGTPVVVTNAGWTRTFVRRHRCGWYVPAEAPQPLARRIAHVLADDQAQHRAARNARTAAREHFDRARHLHRLVSLAERTAIGRAG